MMRIGDAHNSRVFLRAVPGDHAHRAKLSRTEGRPPMLPKKGNEVTWPQGIMVAILVSAVGWFASTVTDMYREGGSTSQALNDNKRFMDQRNRENDRMEALNLMLLQHALQNCEHNGGAQ